MNDAKNRILDAYRWAGANRPRVNAYPHLAAALRQVGVRRYEVTLPSCQTVFFTPHGNVVNQMPALTAGMNDVPRFNRDAFIAVLRKSQLGEIDFPGFLKGSWENGVIRYEADLIGRSVTYYGAEGESYVEEFPEVKITTAM